MSKCLNLVLGQIIVALVGEEGVVMGRNHAEAMGFVEAGGDIMTVFQGLRNVGKGA